MMTASEFPDSTLCRTGHLVGDFWECQINNSKICPHALEFGFSHYICRHPEAHAFNFKVIIEIEDKLP